MPAYPASKHAGCTKRKIRGHDKRKEIVIPECFHRESIPGRYDSLQNAPLRSFPVGRHFFCPRGPLKEQLSEFEGNDPMGVIAMIYVDINKARVADRFQKWPNGTQLSPEELSGQSAGQDDSSPAPAIPSGLSPSQLNPDADIHVLEKGPGPFKALSQ